MGRIYGLVPELSTKTVCPKFWAVSCECSIGSTTGFYNHREGPFSRAFSWLKAPSSAFTFKTLLRHYAKRALTPRSLNVKLGPRRNYHMGRAAIRHYANQTARPL